VVYRYYIGNRKQDGNKKVLEEGTGQRIEEREVGSF
jgi:hypothetical protein